MEVEDSKETLSLLLESKGRAEERVIMLRSLLKEMQNLKLNKTQLCVEYLYYCDVCWEASDVRRDLHDSYCSHCWRKESVVQLKRPLSIE